MTKDDFERLDKIQTKFNEWLRYTEAKNSVLLAVVGTAFFGAVKIIGDSNESGNWMNAYAYSFYTFSLLAFLSALLSFIPKLKAPYWVKFKGVAKSDNPFFFGDACNYTDREYLKALDISCSNNSELEEKMAAQIIVVARIVVIKNSYFTFAVWLFISALITPFVTPFLFLFRD